MTATLAELEAAIKAERRRVASLGGRGRAETLSAKRRKEIATKASKAAALARKKKATKKNRSAA